MVSEPSPKFRVVTWINILIQLLFPLNFSCVHAIGASSSDSSGSAKISVTVPYTLDVGDSVAKIAKKNGTYLEELKKINNYRTFTKPFTALTAGDEFDVPRKDSPFLVDNQNNQTAGLTLKNRLANHAQMGATTAAVVAVTATVGGGSQSVEMTFVVLIFTGVSVNGHTFGIAEGYPSTGFTGTKFVLSISGMTSDYTWDNGRSSWVTVDDSGTVAITAKGNSTPVTITATPKSGGTPLSYTFSVNTWFINNGSTFMRWRDASNWCAAQGLNQPIRGDLKRDPMGIEKKQVLSELPRKLALIRGNVLKFYRYAGRNRLKW